MKMNNRILVTLICGTALSVVAVTGLKAQVKSPVYAVIDISEMTDVDAYIKAVSAYNSPALMELNAVRMKASKSRSFIVEGVTN